ncbi:hypothetical protein [Tritonibacter mobilis]|nr:hypothetical protein [Tritonibacter mobilis]WHQ82152.1 hypothetical protein OMR53_13220 [Tritonibacter mobilis]
MHVVSSKVDADHSQIKDAGHCRPVGGPVLKRHILSFSGSITYRS